MFFLTCTCFYWRRQCLLINVFKGKLWLFFFLIFRLIYLMRCSLYVYILFSFFIVGIYNNMQAKPKQHPNCNKKSKNKNCHKNKRKTLRCRHQFTTTLVPVFWAFHNLYAQLIHVHRSIFPAGLKEIRDTHDHLCSVLKERMQQWTYRSKVGDIFVQFFSDKNQVFTETN